VAFKSIGQIFTVIAVIIIYIIIIIALRIMYKDIRSNGGKKTMKRKPFGLEIIEAGSGTNLKNGSVIPVRGILTVGRKDDNNLQLIDSFVSSHHAKIYEKNSEYIIEDLNSTNGTLINKESVIKAVLNSGDTIKIGNSIFKVL